MANQYRSYTAEELAHDQKFRQWVLMSTPEQDEFWQNWLAENPDRIEVALAAKEFLLAIQEIYEDDLSDEVVQLESEEIVRLAMQRMAKKRHPVLGKIAWRAAAVLAIVTGLGFFYHQTFHRIPEKVAQVVKNKPLQNTILRENTTQVEMTIPLADNSIIILAPGSSIRYQEPFTNHERVVKLKGEGFFDIAANPDSPFLVYTDETVTKVLGTSFRIKTSERDGNEEVIVKTGRVSVFTKKAFDQKTAPPVTLLPNQQAVYDKMANTLVKATITNPTILKQSSLNKPQIFDEKPVTEVFEAIGNIYGIQIIYDVEKLSNCIISTQFEEEDLRQRLNAVCAVIDADYQTFDGNIMINSKGCK